MSQSTRIPPAGPTKALTTYGNAARNPVCVNNTKNFPPFMIGQKKSLNVFRIHIGKLNGKISHPGDHVSKRVW